MKHGEKVALCLAGVLVLQTAAQAVTPDSSGNPYSGIVDRNVFALKPVPPPPPPPDPNVTPPQKIVLTGIVKAFGKKQVFFKTPMSAKPGEAAKETSFVLSEGERAGEIEILEINEVAGTIRLKNHGLEQSLSLEKDGMKPQSSPGVGPGALPTAPNFGVPGAGPPGASLTPVPNFGSGASTVQRPLRVIPPKGASATPTAISPEAQVILMEVNRKLEAEKVAKGEMPPLPETPFTPKPAPR